jgi:chaperonin GroEL
MGMTYRKVKTVSKVMVVRENREVEKAKNWWNKFWSKGEPSARKATRLDHTVLDTMKTISDLVGSTLGPGGHSVLLERQEHDLPNFVTKDGVTVFRAMGFSDPVKHAIMEAARDASVRTASEAGDGTTTATILAYSIVKNIAAYTARNPAKSPQKIIRKLQDYFKSSIEPSIREHSTPCEYGTESGNRLLRAVAKLSANGDAPLADAVMGCLELVGDQGNVTITEISGPSSYEIDHVEGFPINVGYEDSCGRFNAKFINDPGNQRVYLEKPIFLLFHGRN